MCSPALSLKDGSVLPSWPVDVEASLKSAGHKFVSSIQNQRGAVTIGAVVFAGGGTAEAMSEVRRFQTPIVIGRRLYVAADQRLYAFAL